MKMENVEIEPKQISSESKDGVEETFCDQQKELIEKEERGLLNQFIEEQQHKINRRQEQLKLNQAAYKERPELNTALLDSSLKKNTAFIKKMRCMTEGQCALLEKELLSLNLSKYVSELVQAVVDARLKMADVATAVHLCSLLHRRYQEFAPTLLQSWHKLFTLKKDEKITNLSKLRVDLRLFAECIASGMFLPKESLRILGNLLTTLVNTDKEEHQNMSVLLSFCRHCGDEYIGLVSAKMMNLAKKYQVEIPKSDFLPAERQKKILALMNDYFASVVKHLINDHKELQKLEQQNSKMMQTRGEIPEDRKNRYDNMKTSLSKLLTNAHTLADFLNTEVPEMPELKSSEPEDNINEGLLGGDLTDDNGLALWEDEDTKAFYTNLPDLKALLPSILYADSEKATVQVETVQDEPNLDDDQDDSSKEEDSKEEPVVVEEEVEEPTGFSSSKAVFNAYLNTLPNCISRDLMDSAALEFCLKHNIKPFRKKLAKSIFLVSRTRLDLLPFYSRLVASLQPLMPDLATDLVTLLRQEFRYQLKKKDQINIESKVKVARFIGELTKFEVFPKEETLNCFRQLLQDFKHHHIEMTCNLLETSGRYLYRTPKTHHKMKVYLEQMMRKKTVQNLDPRYVTMVENAYYYVNPPENTGTDSQVVRPPMHQFIRRLLYVNLSKYSTEKVLKQVRKLHWEDKETANYIIKCLWAVWNAKFHNIRCLANLVAGLVSYQDWIATAVVDGVLEDIRLGMEVNEQKFNQRRIAAAKYLGELYNYRVIESLVVFKVLYSIITFGVSWDPDNPSDYDPPDHLMRLRLVCTILDACGQFFSSGASKKRLDIFLVYFQHYYQIKQLVWPDNDFPWQIQHLVEDTILAVRPKSTIYKNVIESQNAVAELNKQIIEKAVQLMPELADEEIEASKLQTIPENEEIAEMSTTPVDNASFVDVDDFEDDDQNRDMSKFNEDVEEWDATSQSLSQLSQSAKTQEGDSLTGETDSKDMCDVNFSVKKIECPEDNDFMSAFDSMLSDNLAECTRETSRVSQQNISVPMHVRSSTKKTYEQLLSEEHEEKEKAVVNFVLLTRTGNKQQYTNVEMPIDSELVTKLRTREEEERAERDRVKQLTLEINERQEEEEAFEMMQQTQRVPSLNVNRERRLRYQHPKGAPDADLIFGNSLANLADLVALGKEMFH